MPNRRKYSQLEERGPSVKAIRQLHVKELCEKCRRPLSLLRRVSEVLIMVGCRSCGTELEARRGSHLYRRLRDDEPRDGRSALTQR